MLREAGMATSMYCFLSGSFTSHQKILAKQSVAIDRDKVIRAFYWLKANNSYYKDIVIPETSELPIPIIIDQSKEEPSGNSSIEKKHETTIYFPQAADIDRMKGGLANREDFLQYVISLQGTDRAALLSKSTSERLKHWEPDGFIKSFPRQFPYGYGRQPNGMNKERFAKHLMLPSFSIQTATL